MYRVGCDTIGIGFLCVVSGFSIHGLVHVDRTTYVNARKMYRAGRDIIGIGFLFVVDKLHAHRFWKGLMLVRCIELAAIQLGSDFFASCRAYSIHGLVHADLTTYVDKECYRICC